MVHYHTTPIGNLPSDRIITLNSKHVGSCQRDRGQAVNRALSSRLLLQPGSRDDLQVVFAKQRQEAIPNTENPKQKATSSTS
jgi:hypothetical protein